MSSTTNPWVDVRDFGAKGDGKTDDTGYIEKALKSHLYVIIPPGEYRIDGSLEVRAHLYLLPGATLIRKESQLAGSTDPVIFISATHAALIGGGWVKTENDSPRGVICVGPIDLTKKDQNINWVRIDGVKIYGINTKNTNIGLNVESSEPCAKSGSNYNGNFSNMFIRDVAIGVKVGPVCNGHTFSNIFLYRITQYSYWSMGNSENTFYGGFTHLSHDITMIKLDNVGYNLFYGVQGEPGGTKSRYFEADSSSKYCQILGHDHGALHPINASKDFTYLSSGRLTLVTLRAIESLIFHSGTPYEGILDHNITAPRTWTFPDVSGKICLQAPPQNDT